MWTAILESASIDSTCDYTIVYVSGGTKFRKGYTSNQIDDATVEATARAEIARLSSVGASVGKLSYQSGAQISLAVAPPVAPTPEQLARDKFLADDRQRDALLRAAKKGYIDAADKRITDLQASTKAAWLDSYVGLV